MLQIYVPLSSTKQNSGINNPILILHVSILPTQEQLPPFLGDQAFDSVAGNGILHHVFYHIDTVLLKIRAILKPGGVLSFIEPNIHNPYIVTIFSIPFARKFARLEPAEMAFSSSFITDRLIAAGFVVVTVEYHDILFAY